jgi:hypothetical protein
LASVAGRVNHVCHWAHCDLYFMRY